VASGTKGIHFVPAGEGGGGEKGSPSPFPSLALCPCAGGGREGGRERGRRGPLEGDPSPPSPFVQDKLEINSNMKGA
jgi:hypothetical protein